MLTDSLVQILKKNNFVSIWHLTTTKNLPSILSSGLLSRNIKNFSNIEWRGLGWDQIKNQRPAEFENNWIACHINPHNKFTIGRRKHFKNIEETLTLIEIDLPLLLNLKNDESNFLVSNMNLASSNSTFEVETGPLDKYYEFLDFKAINSFLEDSPEKNDLVSKKRMAEVLVKDRIPPETIKRLWVPDDPNKLRVNLLTQNIEILTAENYFSNLGDLPFEYRPNLKPIRKPIKKPSIDDLVHAKGYGVGKVVQIYDENLEVDFGSFGVIKLSINLIEIINTFK